MKPLKNSKQRNFKIDIERYTVEDLYQLELNGVLAWVFGEPRISIHDIINVKIICDDGYYIPVAITRNRETIYIIL